jgi:large subunit ribosomal protein L21
MTYAIIETGGKQMRVEPGRFYDVELLHVEPEGSYSIDKVLLVHHEDEISIGQPFVSGAIVNGTVLRHFRGRKIIVYKMRPKKKTRKKRGHRQEITRLLIDSISLDGKIIAGEEVAATPAIAQETVVETEAPEVVATEVVDAPVEATPEVEAPAPAVEESPSAPKKKKK